MKKLSRTLMASCIVVLLAASAFAGTIAPPVYPSDYKAYKPIIDPTTSGNNVIPGWGYIGLDADIEPNPDPDKPPSSVSSYINVEVPTQFLWAAFDNAVPAGQVVSPNYIVKNNDPNANLNVTLQSFAQVTGAGIDNLPGGSTLTLNLTGTEMALSNVTSVGSQNHLYPTQLSKSSSWTFGISGNYSGTYPAVATKPKYKMTLKFAVKSVDP